MSLHKCPVLNCGEMVEYNRFACKEDWYRLPREIRSRMYLAWITNNEFEHLKIIEKALDWYDANL